jgi:hypothetical protein
VVHGKEGKEKLWRQIVIRKWLVWVRKVQSLITKGDPGNRVTFKIKPGNEEGLRTRCGGKTAGLKRE